MSTYNRPSSNDVIIICVEYSPEIKPPILHPGYICAFRHLQDRMIISFPYSRLLHFLPRVAK
jgi:hypothetical protein